MGDCFGDQRVGNAVDESLNLNDALEHQVAIPDQVAKIVREAILSGKYAPGVQLNEVALSTRLQISRSPVREGLRKLADEGLVELQPRRGAFVASFDLSEIQDLMEFRQALDVAAAGIAARRATSAELDELTVAMELTDFAHKESPSAAPRWESDFHILILRASRNPKILLRGIEVHTQLHLVRFRSGAEASVSGEVQNEHKRILDALKGRDSQEAEAAMRHHLQRAGKRIEEVVRRSSLSSPHLPLKD
jgi:DNA-binding GntR family transcriptional regulator